MSYCPLRAIMRRVAPRVEELSGLRIPRRHGHMVHPRIKWLGYPWHLNNYGRYRPDKKTIYLSAQFVSNAAHPDLISAVVAHEYVHYLQDLRWSRKKWDDVYELEKFALEVEQQFLPEEFKMNLDFCLEQYL